MHCIHLYTHTNNKQSSIDFTTPTRCSHLRPTVQWLVVQLNYADEPSQVAFEQASQNIYDVITSQQGSCVDSRFGGVFGRMNVQSSRLLNRTSGCTNVYTLQKFIQTRCTTRCRVYTHFYIAFVTHRSSEFLYCSLEVDSHAHLTSDQAHMSFMILLCSCISCTTDKSPKC